MRGRLWTITLAFMAVVFILLLPAFPAQASSVNVVDENSALTKDTMAGGQTQWSWYIYNNDSSPVHVQVELAVIEGSSHLDSYLIEIGGSTGTVQIDPGKGERLVLSMNSNRLSSSTMVHGIVLITVTNLSDVSHTDNLSFNITLHISSIYSGEDSYNRIMGFFPNALPAPLDGPWGALLATMLLYALIAASLYVFI